MTRPSTTSRRLVAFAAALVAALLFTTTFTTTAHAQLHWDASAQAGIEKRVLGARPAGGKDAGFGPALQLAGHIAFLPLVRLGAYVGHDISPLGGDASARDITWGGARVKVMSPWPRGAMRLWVFFGFGYDGVYQRSTSAPRNFPGPTGMPVVRGDAVVHGAGGGFFEVPYGIGASYKLRKPWELCAELGGRTGFGFSGSAYEAPGPRVSSVGRPDSNALPAGNDRFAIGLTVGVLVDL
jgi:hypothetical protein